MAIERIQRIAGTALPLRGESIDTDRIIPARFLRSVSFEGLEQHLFEDDRQQADAQAPGTHPLSMPAYRGATVMVVNGNFGCGSSREHAPQAIRRYGFRAVIGESFSEIFFGNSVALGMPCVTASKEAVHALQDRVEREPRTEIVVDLAEGLATAGDLRLAVSLPAAARESFLEGTWDATALLLDRYEEVEAVAARLPYVSGWR
jgi:3-isopropylmalate/(R)-2-methylmalate dehydratase small subunit